MSSYMSPINYPCRKCSWPNHFRGGVPDYRTCNRCGAEVSEDDEKKALQRANHKRDDNQADRIEALEAENARLRGALERYADESNWIETSAVNDDPHDGWLRDVWDGGGDGWTEARAALQDKKET